MAASRGQGMEPRAKEVGILSCCCSGEGGLAAGIAHAAVAFCMLFSRCFGVIFCHLWAAISRAVISFAFISR